MFNSRFFTARHWLARFWRQATEEMENLTGTDYTVRNDPAHYTATKSQLHYTSRAKQLHYTATGNN